MTQPKSLIRDSSEYPAIATDEGDTLPPSGGRGTSILDKDETVGLVQVLYHAQQGVLAAGNAVDDAREANDEELAQFLEASQRESAARAARAKQLLLRRLKAELGDVTIDDIHEAQHGRIHYVSIPDDSLSTVNSE